MQHHSREHEALEMNIRKGNKADLPKNGLELKAKFLSRTCKKGVAKEAFFVRGQRR